ncbi:hypothetical protein CTM_14143 [Clostridium tetanomorphum DSM 665]|uniref:Uncharacterized protein n=1 Tax=Clostridium tetanomorphum TaxID=1553 RepID=A0A923ED04_CLOTT|nr:hypothetical protein [Clostridium tetanomorphum]KAJ51189.1 hypothetical protein CTM_14143 [Clostridium tetanomorphum DSM 665]MBC2399787.1 hypothetical protein [Clostridium tetanomorphum]
MKKNLKLSRNLWLFSGFCFLLAFIINLSGNKPPLLFALNGITSCLCFINVYITNKKIIKDNED